MFVSFENSFATKWLSSTSADSAIMSRLLLGARHLRHLLDSLPILTILPFSRSVRFAPSPVLPPHLVLSHPPINSSRDSLAPARSSPKRMDKGGSGSCTERDRNGLRRIGNKVGWEVTESKGRGRAGGGKGYSGTEIESRWGLHQVLIELESEMRNSKIV